MKMGFKVVNSEVIDPDITCGLGCCRWRWMQTFVCKELIVATLSIFMMVSASHYFYMYGTLSTIEKLYKLSSRAIASLETSVELGHLIVSFSIAYFIGKGHKARWFAFAVFLCAVASFVEILPYFIFRTGDHFEYDNSRQKQSVFNTTDNCDVQNVLDESSNYAYYNFLIACFILGIAWGIVRSTGFVYLDDNVSKNEYLFLSCLISVAGEVGSSSGFIFSSVTLGYFVDLTVPKFINKNDPRWVGAWWLGFIPYGISFLVISFVAFLLPRFLPEAAERRKFLVETASLKKGENFSVQDFVASVKNILTKRIVVLDLCSAVCLSFSGVAYSIFYPKYMEIIFDLSASQSNGLIGYFSVFGRSVAVLALGICMSKFKPLPRTLIRWSILLQSTAVALLLLLLFLRCPQRRINGHRNADESWSLVENCNKNYNCEETKYSPVCQVDEQILYFSPCYAGCDPASNVNISHVFRNCSCVPEGQTVINGPCEKDNCSSMLLTALVAVTLYLFIGVPVNAMRNMMRLRYVQDDERAFYMSLHKGITIIFSCLARTLYGSILDYTCLFFSKSCGKKGNCWWYNADQLRYFFNSITIGAILLAIVADLYLWYHIHGLKIYDENIEVTAPTIEKDSKSLPKYKKSKSDEKSS